MPEVKEMLAAYRGEIPLRMIPPQPRQAMSELFSQASVLVLPSVEDGFGLVIGQAMACGIPVIASMNTGGPDIITTEVDGMLVPARDARALGDALTLAYEHPAKLEAMGVAARATLERAGGWTAYGDSVIRACLSVRARLSTPLACAM
jgi:glycosyltransferase involved in cell wall biosynthesis